MRTARSMRSPAPRGASASSLWSSIEERIADLGKVNQEISFNHRGHRGRKLLRAKCKEQSDLGILKFEKRSLLLPLSSLTSSVPSVVNLRPSGILTKFLNQPP